MSFTFEEGKDQIIDSVVDHIKSKLSGSQARQCAQFVKRFFSTAAVEDLKEWSIDDLYGAALSFWKMMAVREPHQTKIRIYNPDYERHGWQTTHTVIEIVSDDMPFLVVYYLFTNQLLNLYRIIGLAGISLLSIGFAYESAWIFFYGSLAVSTYAFYSASKGRIPALIWGFLNIIFAVITLTTILL